MKKEKLSLALFPLTTCSGCENAILDSWSKIPESFIENIEIVYSPLISDSVEPNRVDIGIVTGSLRLNEDVDKLFRWRNKSKILIAFGSCSCFGGLPGLLNVYNVSDTIVEIYGENIDFNTYNLPKLIEYVKPVSEIVSVDIMVPGCPPPEKFILSLIGNLIENKPFQLIDKSLCFECPLNINEIKTIKELRRFLLPKIKVEKCFLEDGVLCLGIVTRCGCEAKCIRANTPCRGCLGSLYDVDEAAVKFLSSIASSLSISEIEIGKFNEVKDLIGFLYRYTLPLSKFASRNRGLRNE
ncbi:MAG: hypothetical protein NZ926_02250 [Candidatus Methanomethylicia archaeon]|nr:hypothetical protein [Candidatus Methanomethylicia archaeon]MCX8169259.1 hypothetical protein [Candidatus Methanomethylicia archaeon]MDW7988959.1 hypothetical protein [Nitrososphaerota archaeon]